MHEGKVRVGVHHLNVNEMINAFGSEQAMEDLAPSPFVDPARYSLLFKHLFYTHAMNVYIDQPNDDPPETVLDRAWHLAHFDSHLDVVAPRSRHARSPIVTDIFEYKGTYYICDYDGWKKTV